jgi:hypothetical protein
VQVNGQDEPATVASTHTITFTITPPANLQHAESGETVSIAVLLSTSQSSNSVVVPVASCRIVVVGDSVLWGEGLLPGPPAMKISDLVRGRVATQLGDVDTFVDLLAHAGAVISGGAGSPVASGEVPDQVPTVTAQVAAIADGENVDLVIVDGGINDVSVPVILDPATTPAALSGMIMTACGSEMTTLLASVIATCPNAQVVVTSYYPILSGASDTTLIALLLAFVGGIPRRPDRRRDRHCGVELRVVLQRVLNGAQRFRRCGEQGRTEHSAGRPARDRPAAGRLCCSALHGPERDAGPGSLAVRDQHRRDDAGSDGPDTAHGLCRHRRRNQPHDL